MNGRVVDKQEVIDTVATVRSLCARLDPVAVALHEVPDVFDQLADLRKLADGALLRMTARYEESCAWKRNGAKSADDDIATKTGSSKGAARRRMATSKRLANQPKTEAAVRDGALSEEQAVEVSAGAHASPEDEDELLATAAKRPLHELAKASAGSRAKGEDSEARARRMFKNRCMRRFLDHEDMANLLLKLPPERMAEVDAFLARLIDQEYADARDRGLLEEYEAYAADVVYRLLSGQQRPHGPAATAESGDEEEPNADAPAGAAPGPCSCRAGRARNANGVRPDRKVVAVIDVAALNRGHVEGDETCDIVGVGPVSVTAVRSMLSDAFLAVVFKDGVDVLNVTHLGRQVTSHQRTALEARGWWCQRCGSTRRVQIDHGTGWALTHDTRLDDLRLACGHCHGLKTRHDLRWAGPFGQGHFVDRDGNRWDGPSGARGADPPGDPPDASATTGSSGADRNDAEDLTLFAVRG